MRERIEIEGPGGRRLEVELDGPEDGRMLLLQTGTPGAGRLFDPLVQAGADRGLRHVSYSRPGYAGSERQPGRTVADCAADVIAIADALAAECFFTIGWSGGGPHALACASLLPERVVAAATIAGIAPADADGLDWLAGMGAENLEEFAAAAAGEEQLRTYLAKEAGELEHATGPELHAALGNLLSQVDTGALTGAFAEYVAQSFRDGLSPGFWGWFDDDLAFLADWGFDLAQVETPVAIWQGEHDRFVPFAHGQWLAAHVGAAQPRLLGDHGHLSLVLGAYGDVLDDLLALERSL